jgi:glycine/D-amino acid oxidase-like deaminating enzyme
MNAWVAALRELRRAIVVVASDIVATEPIPGRLEGIGWTDGMCISDSRLLVNYYRLTRDGRLVFGKGGGGLAFGGRVGAAFEGASPRAAEVEQSMDALYPMLADARVTHSWTGPIDRNATAIPLVGRLGGHEGIHYAVGFSGNGVGPSALVARTLASRVLRRDDEWASVTLPERPSGHFPRDPAGWFPPEPARYAGGRLVRAAVARKEAAEDAGRRPTRLDARLTRLAPAGLTPTKAR